MKRLHTVTRKGRSKLVLLALLLGGALTAACGTYRPFPAAEPMVEDPDKTPFEPRPGKYFSPFAWDGIDNSLFRPVSNFFAVDPAGRSVNVTAVDEVANSSWWTNRIGQRRVTPEELAIGACHDAPPLDENGPWTITGGKPDGENPGFFIEGQDGSKYLLKFDGAAQAPRATAADVIVSRLYWAAGYSVPCNRIVFFDKSILTLEEGAKAEKSDGSESPLTQAMIDEAFERAMQLEDGRYRGNASLYLKGRPLGPWRYEGTRDDDPNDVIPHEDRRELRGAAVIASWVNHFDSREQNTLDMWITADGQKAGYVKHNYLDFGDCFGSLWEWDALSRRWGHAHVFDVPHILSDFFTLGLIKRPWDETEFGVTGEVFGYFDIERFEPDAWVNEYPNPSFQRRQEDDNAWMTRILSRFTNAHIRAAITSGRMEDKVLSDELERVLIGRRDIILKRYMTRLSPLSKPRVQGSELCLTDMLADTRLVKFEERTYSARGWTGLDLNPVAIKSYPSGTHSVCLNLPKVDANPAYLIVDVTAQGGVSGDVDDYPARVHLYQKATGGYQVVGLERPDSNGAPELAE